MEKANEKTMAPALISSKFKANEQETEITAATDSIKVNC